MKLITIFGVGSLLLFPSLYISLSEISEHLAYQKDVKPIKIAL
ncbi:hypothetical protein [Peribacillus butanolivorans]|nr:hypothetical protein [Peribacillus butanolivorans]